MKQLLLADLHFQLNWFRWASRADVNAILIAGDLLNGDSQYGLVSQMIAIREWFSSQQNPTAFVNDLMSSMASNPAPVPSEA